jgi:hypothetical protein
MNLSDAIVFLTAPCTGLVGGLLTWLRPKSLFVSVGWCLALFGAPFLTVSLSALPPQGQLWVWPVLYAPIAFVISAFTCSLVSGAGLMRNTNSAHGAIIGAALFALGTYGVYMVGTAAYLVGQS